MERQERSSDDEGEGLLLREGGTGGSDWESEHVRRPETSSEAQEGVRMIEAVSLTWTTRSLVIAYIRYAVIYYKSLML